MVRTVPDLSRAQEEATALLMAYGHGVRARLGDKAALVDSIPQLWPKHSSRPKADLGIAVESPRSVRSLIKLS